MPEEKQDGSTDDPESAPTDQPPSADDVPLDGDPGAGESGGPTGAEPSDPTGAEPSNPTGTDPSPGPEPASVGLRTGSHLLDLALMFFVFWGTAFVVALLVGATGDGGFHIEGAPALVAFLLYFVVMAAYFIGMEAALGWTVGKRILGLEVVTEDGESIGPMEAIQRNVLRIVDGGPFFFWFLLYPLGLGLIATSDDHQRLGDRIADTLVVQRG